MIGGALVIDFVMATVCHYVEYNRYYRENHEHFIAVFHALMTARFVAKKIGDIASILKERKGSALPRCDEEKKEDREVATDDDDEQMVELFVKGKDGTRIEKVPAAYVNFKRRNE